jgi:hypothetical protein
LKPKKPPKLSITEILERVGDVTRRRSNTDIAAELGCSPTAISNWKGRGSIPWLLSGRGPKSAAADGEHEKTIERYEWIIDNLRKGKKRQK